jgi:hypothetical protein
MQAFGFGIHERKETAATCCIKEAELPPKSKGFA